jgi:subtilase family serine protease
LANADVQKIGRWVEDAGFSDLQLARGRNWISFSGNAGQPQAAFGTSLHRYSLRGETHIANTRDPRLPKAWMVLSRVSGDCMTSPRRPHLKRPRHPLYSLANGQQNVSPDDWETIYDVKPLYGFGLDGSGVTIAVVGQSDVQLSDIAAFRAAAGLPVNVPSVIVPPRDADPGIQSATGDETESDLDLEWAGAIAKNAHILFVTASARTGHGVNDSIAYAIDNNVAPILSISYGTCETDEATAEFQAQNNLFQQANAQGMTIVASRRTR